MKTNILIKSAMALALATSLSACDENSWNDKLDGFEDEINKPTPNVQTVEYTLTDADYAQIAANSANKALAGDDNAKALAAVASRKAFSDAIPARDYVPAFLSSTSFPYFTLTDGSAVKLTYNVAQNLPEYLDEAAAAQLFTVSLDDYKAVWESDKDFIEGFAPSHPASKYLPGILGDYLDANDGTYCVVSYKESAQEPVFGGGGAGGDQPGFQLSSTIGSAVLDAPISCKAVVTAVCQQGYIVTDNSGSILVYFGRTFDPSSVSVGQQLEIEGTVGDYNKGFQITGSTATVNLIGEQAVTYPAPKVMTGAEIDQAITRTDDALAQYVQFKATTVISGNYINFNIEGATTAQGSIYQATDAQKALFTDGAEVTVEGYFISISSGKFFNVVPTKVNGVKAQVIKRGLKRAASVPTTTYNAVYHYDNGRWTVPANFCVLNPADYTAMGSTTQDLSAPAKYLPTYLASKYPYAQQGDIRNVMYRFYNSSSKETSYACDQYTFDGSAWVINTGIVTETAQFVRTGGKWMYDPNVTITLPAGRNQELSTKYFQACVDWVFNNICKPMGDTDIKSGAFYVTKYGNNEYYSGTSAYQGNVDLRASAARAQYPTGYEGMTDDEIVELEKQRFMNEVMPGALSMLHPDAKPIEGLDVIYTINFSVYTGTTTAYTARFRVIAPGKFEPVDCTWDNKAE